MTAAATKMKMVVFLGSTREGRLGERVWKFVDNYLKKQQKYEVTLFDPTQKDFDLPLLKKPLFFYKETDAEKPPKALVEANKKLKEADAILLISCEYNHCIPPALANLVDHFAGSSFAWKPSGIITYSPGQFGGMRAAMQLRAMTGEIGCISVSNIFGIPQVHNALDPDGKPMNEHMDKGIAKLMAQVDWMAEAMKKQRETKGTPA